MKLGVMAGTPVDTQMGVDYVISKGHEAIGFACRKRRTRTKTERRTVTKRKRITREEKCSIKCIRRFIIKATKKS